MAISPFLFLLSLLPLALAAPLVQRQDSNSTCESKSQRKSWTALTDTEKSDYISAELCLMSSPPRSGTKGAESRWDELQYLHAAQVNVIHDVGAFLPWHRYFIAVHEEILQTECNYTGAHPYWNEADDVSSFPNLTIFDPNTGFGGNGVGDSNCVADGPFANLTLHIERNGGSGNYCLNRSFESTIFSRASQDEIDTCLAMANYSTAWPCYHGNLHNAGHGGIGGIMGDVALSPGDPFFYMHHANLDRLWWQWQQVNLTARLTDMTGPNVPEESYLEASDLSYPSAAFLDYNGDPGNVTTLNHTLWMNDVRPNATVGDVMDLGGDLICAEYI